MGHPGNPTHPEAKSAVLDAPTRICADGRSPGMLSTDDALIAESLRAGATFVGVAVDNSTLASASRSRARLFRERPPNGT